MIELRPYQDKACKAVFDYWGDGNGSPLIVLPTGTGKSLVLAEISRLCLEYPNTKILIVAHVKELIRQNYEEMLSLWPAAPAGVFSAGAGRRDTDEQIIFCSIQSIFRPRVFTKFGRVDIILIDEAHLIPKHDTGMYRCLLSGLKMANPHVQIVGLTATPYRLDSGRLDEGEDRFFEKVAYDYPILDAINDGWLCPPTSKKTDLILDVGGVGTRGGEFIAGELENAINIDANNVAAVEETIRWGLAEDRKSWLFFCAGVKHAERVSELVNERGISCEVITGSMKAKERDAIIEAFKAREIRALASMNVLTTGFNAKAVDLIAGLRPTKSAGLYVQMVGRGTRLSPETGKVNCRYLDFAGNIERFGPIDDVRIPKKKEGGGEAPYKICPVHDGGCGCYCATALRECRNCGYKFPPPPPPTPDRKSSERAILSQESKSEWCEVTNIRYSVHAKAGKPPSLKVTYQCGMSDFPQWIGIESENSYGRGAAITWWTRQKGQLPPPRTTAEAVARCGELEVPAEILVSPEGRFWRIVATRGVLDLPDPGGEGLRIQDNPEWDDIPF